MELPNIGKQCADKFCRQLDFLPVKCDMCKNVFCHEHYPYDNHKCPYAYQKNVQVPVCPLCNQPVPGKPSELPDIRVSRHIDDDCKSDKAVAQRSVYVNKCSSKGCKQREMISIKCGECNKNFCLKHRHTTDHVCQPVKPSDKAASAALSRFNNGPSTSSKGAPNGLVGSQSKSQKAGVVTPAPLNTRQAAYQGNFSDDAALEIALRASMSDAPNASAPSNGLTQEQEDFLFAQAIAASEEAIARPRQVQTTRSNSKKSNCQVS